MLPLDEGGIGEDELRTKNEERTTSHEEANYTTDSQHTSSPSIARGLFGRRDCVDKKSAIDCLHYNVRKNVDVFKFRPTMLTNVDRKVN